LQQIESAIPGNPSEELQEVRRQIENIKLERKLKMLEERERELLKILSTQPQNLRPECFVSEGSHSANDFEGILNLETGEAGQGQIESSTEQASDMLASENGMELAAGPVLQNGMTSCLNQSSDIFVSVLYLGVDILSPANLYPIPSFGIRRTLPAIIFSVNIIHSQLTIQARLIWT